MAQGRANLHQDETVLRIRELDGGNQSDRTLEGVPLPGAPAVSGGIKRLVRIGAAVFLVLDGCPTMGCIKQPIEDLFLRFLGRVGLPRSDRFRGDVRPSFPAVVGLQQERRVARVADRPPRVGIHHVEGRKLTVETSRLRLVVFLRGSTPGQRTSQDYANRMFRDHWTARDRSSRAGRPFPDGGDVTGRPLAQTGQAGASSLIDRFPMTKLPRSIIPLAAVAGSLLACLSATPAAEGQANDRRVVLMVWDGLRPDSINDADTPALAGLAREGVFFAQHHPVYPSSTEVNGTALVTGCQPGHSGLIGNREYRPAIDALKTIATEDLATMRRGDEVTGGHYLRVPTLPELLRAADRPSVVAGTKPVAAVLDRAARPDDARSTVLFEGHTLPESLATTPAWRGEPFPQEIHFPNVAQDEWTTGALTNTLWKPGKDGLPALTVLWMSDPDYTQHQFGPDTPQAHRALASADADLAAVLRELDARGLRATTDVMVVSDHGFSTIGRGVDTARILNDAGFHAGREYKAAPQRGDVLVDGLGGSVFLYVAEHDADTVRRLATFLQASDFAGVIFTHDALPGTFTLSAAHIDSPDAPDLVVAMRWNDDKNTSGLPGKVVSDGGRKPGQGTHATLGRYDMHNTLVAAGPDFRQGWRDELPSGNVDVAPTIAHLLGMTGLPKMDGRVLEESLRGFEGRLAHLPAVTRRLEAHGEGENAAWSQYLQVTRFGDVEYLDEGNFVSR